MKDRNPIAYNTEYLANFRTDLTSMYDPVAINKAINYERPLELPFQSKNNYIAFVDCAGGGGTDAYAMAIGHLDDQKVIIDVVRSRAPKYNPDEITAQYCNLLKDYSVHSVTGDRYSGDFISNSFLSCGVHYEKSEKSKSELYLEAESVLNTERIEIPNKEPLVTQLKNLVRKARSGGKDSVDSDWPEDEANVVAGVTYLLLQDLNYVRTPPPSFGVSYCEKTLEEKLEEDASYWLFNKPRNPGMLNDD
jgi:hypothetical protein